MLLLAGVVGGLVWTALSKLSKPSSRGLEGYLIDDQAVEQEYVRFNSRPLSDPLVRQDFRYAAGLVARGDYAGAISVLEQVAKKAPVPAVFNDLGVLYVERNDSSRAIEAFRQAVIRDTDYQPVRANLLRAKDLLNAAAPVVAEDEPNDTYLLANVIALNRPVTGDVSAYNDTDCYRLTIPSGPRDLLSVEIEPLASMLLPGVSAFDRDDHFLDWTRNTERPGATLIENLSAAPKSVLVLHLWGFMQSQGKYRLTVRPLQAFDRYEPNDNIISATRVPLRETLEANIMDAADKDYYSFVAPARGNVTVKVHRVSNTLMPTVTAYSPDRHPLNSSPAIAASGADLSRSLEVKPKEVYFIEIESQNGTAGSYTINIE
jgi:tetratricopeptide (TPR) repeat protein